MGLGSSIYPGVTATGVLRTVLRHEQIGSLSLSGLLSVANTQPGSDPTSKLEQRLYGIGVQLCGPAYRAGWSRLTLCLEERLGRLLVYPGGFQSPERESGFWMEMGPSAILNVPIVDPIQLYLGLALWRRLAAPRISINEMTLEPEFWGLGGELGVGVEF
jgi:hypothetical protein